MKDLKMRNRRYYLHSRVKSFAKVHAKSKQIDIPFDMVYGVEKVLTDLQSKYIENLIGFGYNIQLVIKLT